MAAFIDTSAFFVLLAEDDQDHAVAAQRLQYLTSNHIPLVTSNYVVMETCALLQRRIGMLATQIFRTKILPRVWVTRQQDEAAWTTFLAASRRKLSLVDCVSFEIMRDSHIQMALAFDQHFTEHGFDCEIPTLRSN